MMLLPADIHTWANLLQALPNDLRNSIEQMGHVLSSAIKLQPTQHSSGKDEPDGISGIHSKVNYERLLMSEWGILHEYPDEFIRRAASGEHQFYKLVRREVSHDESVYVLFDCGPEQLGRPRVVQLALLILFLRHTEAVKAKLFWGVLQDKNNHWYEGLSPKLVEQWLSMHSADLLDKAQLKIRINELNNKSIIQHKIWCITPEKINDFPDLTQITIQGDIHNNRNMRIQFRHGKHSNVKRLSLPEDSLCNRIISNPFNHLSQLDNNNKNWCISPSGLFMLFFDSNGNLTFNRVNSRKKTNTKHSPYDSATLLGYTTKRNNAYTLFATKNEYLLKGFPAYYSFKSYSKTHNIQPNSGFPKMVVIDKFRWVILLDEKQSLRCIEFQTDQLGCNVTTIAKSVLAFGSTRNYFYCILFDQDERTISLHWEIESEIDSKNTLLKIRKMVLQAEVSNRKPAVLVCIRNSNRVEFVAICQLGSTWFVTAPHDNIKVDIVVPSNQKVLAVHRLKKEPVLVCINKHDKQTLSFIGHSSEEVFYILTEPCEQIEFNSSRYSLHYKLSNNLIRSIDIQTGNTIIDVELAT